MIRDLEIFPPINDDEVIWRYMDFASFYSLLLTKGLFFRRVDKYSDQYEGTLPDEIKEQFIESFSLHSFPFENKEDAKEKMENSFIAHLRELNKGTLCCSWVINKVENYAMWKIYLGGSREGVSIRTTVGKLKAALKNNTVDFTFTKVSYDMPLWMESDYKTLVAFKTKPYSYESELRVLVYDQFETESVPMDVFPKVPLFEHGTTFSADTSVLIDEVHISPFAENWFYEVIKSAIQIHLPSYDNKNIMSSKIKDK